MSVSGKETQFYNKNACRLEKAGCASTFKRSLNVCKEKHILDQSFTRQSSHSRHESKLATTSLRNLTSGVGKACENRGPHELSFAQPGSCDLFTCHLTPPCVLSWKAFPPQLPGHLYLKLETSHCLLRSLPQLLSNSLISVPELRPALHPQRCQ